MDDFNMIANAFQERARQIVLISRDLMRNGKYEGKVQTYFLKLDKGSNLWNQATEIYETERDYELDSQYVNGL